ncbi:MAG: TolC family protein, partial [Candidatus Brocadiae bacterium]|nr:TolC family protein [Candidatus Brocadiia bacterium]
MQEPLRLPERLRLKDAFLLALQANKDILVASLAADADQQRIGAAKGEFDPTVFVEFSRGRTSAPVLGPPLERSQEAEGAFSAGVRQRVWTGTTWELGFVSDYVRDLNATGALNPSYGSEVRLSVEQDLLKDAGTDINRTGILVARNNWEISREQFRGEIIETLFQVEAAYWDLYFALADLEVRQKQLERARKLVARAEAQVNVGLSPRLDIVRAKSGAAAQEVRISRARNEIKRLRHRLLRLLGIIDVSAADAEFALADGPPSELFQTDLSEAVKVAQTARPDYA